ncbi:hypothetical protein APA_4271 [Pseudanabaena sp. lw0831]|nr:hypothetical protein APA_4271 [Pseudanabaena sp. lw0831]
MAKEVASKLGAIAIAPPNVKRLQQTKKVDFIKFSYETCE